MDCERDLCKMELEHAGRCEVPWGGEVLLGVVRFFWGWYGCFIWCYLVLYFVRFGSVSSHSSVC